MDENSMNQQGQPQQAGEAAGEEKKSRTVQLREQLGNLQNKKNDAARRQKQMDKDIAKVRSEMDKVVADWWRGIAGEDTDVEADDRTLRSRKVRVRLENGQEREISVMDCIRTALDGGRK